MVNCGKSFTSASEKKYGKNREAMFLKRSANENKKFIIFTKIIGGKALKFNEAVYPYSCGLGTLQIAGTTNTGRRREAMDRKIWCRKLLSIVDLKAAKETLPIGQPNKRPLAIG